MVKKDAIILDEEAADWMLAEDDSTNYPKADIKKAMDEEEREEFIRELKQEVRDRK